MHTYYGKNKTKTTIRRRKIKSLKENDDDDTKYICSQYIFIKQINK